MGVLAIIGIVIGILIVPKVAIKVEEYCQKNDCRNPEARVESAKTDEEAKKICDKEFGGKTEGEAPVRCLKLYKLK